MARNRYIKWLIICFAAMLGLTFLSRATDSITVAKVNAENPKRGSLVQRAAVDGEINASGKYFMYSDIAFRIQEIAVGEGSSVLAGDTLFTIDFNDLLKKIDQAERELSNLNLEIQRLRLDSANSSNQAALASARAELDRALADDAFNRLLNDDVQMLADKRKIEDAEKKLADAQKAGGEGAQRNQMEIAMKENNRQIKQREYEALQTAHQNGGRILAEISGTVGKIFVTQGETMRSESLCEIIPEGASYTFIGKTNSDNAAYMKTGDLITIALSGKSRPLTGLRVKSLSANEDEVTVLVDLPAGSGAYFGQKATASHEEKSEEYRNVVPLSAIRGNADDYYIFVAREQSGVLGRQISAARVDVTVLETDNRNAAIEGGFSGDDRIIARSSKAIVEGDRVRVQSSEINN